MPVEANVMDDAVGLAALHARVERLDPEEGDKRMPHPHFPKFPGCNCASVQKPVVIGFLAFFICAVVIRTAHFGN